MSFLTRSLNRSFNNNPSLCARVIEWLDYKIHNNFLVTFYYNVKSFMQNLKWMIPAAWKFRTWDYNYNIKLFCDSLDITGNSIKKYGHSVNNEKIYRRCVTAAAQLRQAYNFPYHNDKSYRYLMDSNPFELQKDGIYLRLATIYKNNNEKYYEKMLGHITKRLDKQEAAMKEDAWKYLHKLIETFRD